MLGGLVLSVASAPELGAQQATGHVERGTREAELVERLLDAGLLADLSRLVAPYSGPQVEEALGRIDAAGLTSLEAAWVEELRGRLERGERDGFVRLRLSPGVRVGDGPSTDPFVEAPETGVHPASRATATAGRGPFVVSAGAAWDRRPAVDAPATYATDPEFRVGHAYGAFQRPWGEAVLGLVPWRIGPRAPERFLLDQQVDPAPGLAWSVGIPEFRFRQHIVRLDSIGAESRFLVLHRIESQPIDRLDLALSEIVLWAGEGRDWELDKMNPLGTFFAAQYNEVGSKVNIGFALEGVFRPLDGVELMSAAFVDDLTFLDNWPDRWGVTGGVRALGLVPGWAGEIHYGLATSLLYQPLEPGEFYTYRDIGIASNRADFSRLTLLLHWDPTSRIRLSPVAERIRQGHRDPRDRILEIPTEYLPILSPAEFVANSVGLEGSALLRSGLSLRFSAAYRSTDAKTDAAAFRNGSDFRGWLQVSYDWARHW